MPSIIRDQIERHLWIVDKWKRRVPFHPNAVQERYERERSRWNIELKARRQGFSSWILARKFIKCLKVPNTTAVCISHESEATRRLFSKVDYYKQSLAIKPVLKKETELELYFPKTNSRFYVGTAGAKAFGRGDTITDFHGSEVAYWPNAERLMGGLMEAFTPDSEVDLESTANGPGNYFAQLWRAALAGSNGFTPLFFSWADFPEYVMDPPDGFIPTDAERHLAEVHGLSVAQLCWRRWKVSNIIPPPGITPEAYFGQEYPLTWQEAFISSGKCAFDRESLLSYRTSAGRQEGQVSWWKPPERGHVYIVGADVAEGIESGDYSCAHVLDSETFEQVATWHGHIDPDLFAEELVALAERYNMAYIGWESNNMGIAVGTALKKIYDVNRLYCQENYDNLSKRKTKRLGWMTTDRTRGLMVADLTAGIRDHDVLINDPSTIDECLTFVRNRDGKPEAAEGTHDDRVMALAVALQVAKALPNWVYYREQPKAGPPPGSFADIRKQQIIKAKSHAKPHVIRS